MGGTHALAPWQDPEWEIWGLPWISYPRVDRFFDTHSQEYVSSSDEKWYRDGEWIPEFLKLHADKPIYVDKSRLHLFPSAIDYPLSKVKSSIPIPYLENSVAYQLALAISEETEEIGLWGVHMRGRQEFQYQRPSITYLVGLAQGRGIKVTIAPGSPLFMSAYWHGRYGLGPLRESPQQKQRAGVAPKYNKTESK